MDDLRALENRVAESAGEDLVACRLGIKNRSAWKLPSRETLLFTYELRFPCRVTKLWRIQVPGLPSFSNHVLLFHVRKYYAPSLSSFLPTNLLSSSENHLVARFSSNRRTILDISDSRGYFLRVRGITRLFITRFAEELAIYGTPAINTGD